MGPLLLGIGVGLGVAMWTARPPMVEPHAPGFVFFLLVSWAVAWRLGARGSRDSGDAVAVASASASAGADARAVQMVHLHVGDGARAVASSDRLLAVDEASWRGGAVAGQDPRELLSDLGLEGELPADAYGAEDPEADRLEH